jgi:hypothetical protein
MNAILSGAALLVVVAALVLWQCSDWIEARGEQAREQARRLKLENDRLAQELAERRARSVPAVADRAS